MKFKPNFLFVTFVILCQLVGLGVVVLALAFCTTWIPERLFLTSVYGTPIAIALLSLVNYALEKS